MRKKQKVEDFIYDSDGSNLSDRKLRSSRIKNAAQPHKSRKTSIHVKTTCNYDESTDDYPSDTSDDPKDYIDNNSSDLEYGGKLVGKSNSRKNIACLSSAIFICCDDVIETLHLTPSANDLLLDMQSIWSAVGIYEVLYQFSSTLRLTPFRFENFCCALSVQENTKLLAECHISLLRCVLKEEDQNNITFVTKDTKDSVAISLFCMDDLTWYENVCMYLQSLGHSYFKDLKSMISQHYTNLTVEQKLAILQILVDLFLMTNSARDALFKDNELVHEEHCRSCHKRGNLLCCESCPAMYHLSCINPPLESIPSGDWYCIACYKHKAVQTEELECTSLKNHLTDGRREPIGYDRNGRRYWHLCRRIFVEDEKTLLAYYSTEDQLEELMEKFDSNNYEQFLLESFKAAGDDIAKDMRVTAELTNKYKDSRKTCLVHDNEQVESRRMKEMERKLDEAGKLPVYQTLHSEKVLANKIESQASKSQGQCDLTNIWSSEPYFKLGMEGGYKKYVNVYSTEVLALSRQQQVEEREKKRHLSYKFSLTEFSWFSNGKNIGKDLKINGSCQSIVEILRKALINFQESIPKSFMHSNWPLHSSRWLKAVSLCKTAREFGLAMLIFEACVKPMVFNSVWHQSVGHTCLHRTTAAEREEEKKKEKDIKVTVKEEMNSYSETSVKYSLGLNHAVWKQNGEEYRITGKHSWCWIGLTRNSRVSKFRQQNQKALEEEDEEDRRMEICDFPPSSDVFDVQNWISTKEPITVSYPKTVFLNKLLGKRLELDQHFNELCEKVSEKLSSDAKACVPEMNNTEGVMRTTVVDNTAGEAVESTKKNFPSENLNDIIKHLESSLKSLETSTEEDRQVKIKELMTLMSSVNSTTLKVSLKNVFSSTKSKKLNGGIPKAHYFEACRRKTSTSIYILDGERLHKLARKSGLMEVQGFNYTGSGTFCPYVAFSSNVKALETYRFSGCPRPNFQVAWRYRTRSAGNLYSFALQMKILHSCIRWDDMFTSYPSDGILVVDGGENDTDDVSTFELLKRRIITSKFDPTSYKVEYLVLKTVIPKETSQSSSVQSLSERSMQRTGLRERRVAEPVTTREWVSEDQLELWQIRYFADMWEKQTKKNNDKSSSNSERKVQKTPTASTPTSKNSNSTTATPATSSRPGTPTSTLLQKTLNPSSNANKLKSFPSFTSSTGLTNTPSSLSVAMPTSSGSNMDEELRLKRLELQRRRLESKPVVKAVSNGGASSEKSEASQSCPNELVKNISVVKSTDGKVEVLGLKEGQSSLQLSGENIKLIISPQTKASQSTENADTSSKPRPTVVDQSSNEIRRRLNYDDDSSSRIIISPSDEKSCEASSTGENSDSRQDNNVQQATEQATKILASLKNAFNKRITVDEFNFYLKSDVNKSKNKIPIKPESVKTDVSRAGGGDAPLVGRGVNNNVTDSMDCVKKEELVIKDSRSEMNEIPAVRNSSTPVKQKNSEKNLPIRSSNVSTSPVGSNSQSACMMSLMTATVSHSAEDKSPALTPRMITVGQISSASAVPKRLAVFNPPVPDDEGSPMGEEYYGDDDDDCSITRCRIRRKRKISCDENPTNKKLQKKNQRDSRGKSDDGSVETDVKLYCLCRTPYDNTKFYVGCSNCGGWYHGSCVGMSPNDAASTSKYICKLCQHQSSNELHCTCRTPYDETRFYIGCDVCFGWFHGECVGILPSEARKLNSFKCPSCRTPTKVVDEKNQLHEEHFIKMLQLLQELKNMPLSGPFLDDTVQRNKRGFNFIEEKLLIRSYKKLEEFVEDADGFFSDLRYYSLKQSDDYKAANKLQNVFQLKLQRLKKKILN